MKKIAYFIALMVGLNATVVVRKPEEDEQQAIVQKDDESGTNKNTVSVIQQISETLKTCFYAITKDGRMDVISWERIAKIFGKQKAANKNNASLKNDKTIWLQINYESDGERETTSYQVLEK